MCSIRPLKDYFVYKQGELVNYLMISIGYISIVHPGVQSMTIVDKGCDVIITIHIHKFHYSCL